MSRGARSRSTTRNQRSGPGSTRHRRSLRDAGEKLELDESELESIDADLARRSLELES